MRRRIPWYQVREKARRANGAWVLHPTLAAADAHLLQHARRRVPALKATDTHVFEFARNSPTEDELGRPIFDLYVRYVPKGTDP